MTVPAGYRYNSCRLLGHSWLEVPSDWEPKYGIPMTVRCERCDMERRDAIGRHNGEVESRQYVQPDGYSITLEEGNESPRRVDFRLEWLHQHIAKIEQQPTTRKRSRKS